MKMSDAMLLGYSMVLGKTKNIYYKAHNDCACALGCAIIGYTGSKDSVVYTETKIPGFYTIEYKYFKQYHATIVQDNDLFDRSIPEIAQRLKDIGE